MRPRVLLADDESSVRLALRRIIEDQGCDVTPVSDGQQALDALARGTYQLVVTDLRMPEVDGMQVLRAAAAKEPPVPVVVLTGYGTVERAVEAMRLGAANFLTKPFEIADVEAVVREILNLGSTTSGGHLVTRQDVRSLPPRRNQSGPQIPEERDYQLIGISKEMERIRGLIEQVADSDVTVLLTGESGTGKEVVARLIHERSSRNRGPFIPVNCAAIPEPLLESELFGHVKGSFTGATHARTGRFALAAGGTLFLDEIAEMSLPLQAKVLRVLQDKEITPVGGVSRQRVDVRILSATNRDLQKAINEERFREDLYYRLNVIPVHLRPLREHPEDIPVLSQHFLNKARARRGRTLIELTALLDESALLVLCKYSWPGNVRELENLIERILHLHTGGGPIGAADLPLYANLGVEPSSPTIPGPGGAATRPAVDPQRLVNPSLPEGGVDLRGELEQIEQSLIAQAMERAGGNRSEAAQLLRMNRTTLVEKLRRFKDVHDLRVDERLGADKKKKKE